VLLAGAALLPGATAQEFRGAWVARDGLGSRAQIVNSLNAFAQARCNVVCVNVWSRGYTIYPSAVMARVAGVAQDPGYAGRDPLAEFVFEAHRRGIEVEAWFEYGFMFAWSGYLAGPNGRGPVLNANPTWVAMDRAGNTQVSDGGGGFWTWAAAENPGVRAFLLDLTAELVERYDVDGVQFDRVRYPSTAFGYDPATVAAWSASHGGSPPPTNPDDAAWMRFRADGLNAFQRALYARVKERRASVRVSNAPIALPTNYASFLQDWPAWLRDGAVDSIYPQIYRTTAASYISTLDANLAALRAVDRPKVAPGVRAISGTPTAEVLAMVAANRARGLPGEVFWYMEGLYDDLPALAAGPYAAPATIPGRAAGFRALPVQREENDATTTRSSGWTPLTTAAASGGQALTSQPSAAEWLEFHYTPAATGLYSLHAHQTILPAASAATAQRATHAGGELLVRVDQRNAANAGWRDIGVLWLTAGAPATLRIDSSPGELVVADAALWMVSRLGGGPITTYGAGTAGQFGVPAISLSGSASLGSRMLAQVSRLPAAAPVVLALGTARVSLPLFGGTLLTLPELTFVLSADGRGEVALPLAIPSGANLRGFRFDLQALALDAAGPQGWSFTRGAETVIN
jgi:uncharacterized lipoprotein YddW (UPF0748 family)